MAGNSVTYYSSCMLIGARIADLLELRGLSQAELARRVGLSQPTIFGLIHKNKTGSAHLHRIARELGTTPAYLSGETDDPDSNLPDEPQIDSAEREWIDLLRGLNPDDRAAVLRLTRSLATSATSSTLQGHGRSFRGAAKSEWHHDVRLTATTHD